MAQAVVLAIVSGGSLIKPPKYSRSGTPRLSTIKCSSSSDNEESRANSPLNTMITRVILSTVAAGLLLASPVSIDNTAIAAPSGGRIGGQSFRSAPRAPPRSAPPPRSGPRINNSRTNIYINPPGYGYGSPFFGGGWGWSPFSFFFAPPAPTVAVGVAGFDFVPILLAFLVLGWISRAFFRRNRDEDDYYD